MTTHADLPAWAALATALLVVLGATVTLTGSLGLLRLKDFYDRVHAPTLGTTIGTGCVLIASMLYFSILQSRPVVHEVLIAVFVTATTPVTLMMLARAALFRDRAEGNMHDVAPAPSSDDIGDKPSSESKGRLS